MTFAFFEEIYILHPFLYRGKIHSPIKFSCTQSFTDGTKCDKKLFMPLKI